MWKGLGIGLVVGLASLGLIGGASQQNSKDLQRFQAEIGDATPIKIGVLTRKQRSHSKLYNGYGKHLPGESISDLIVAYRGKKIVLETNVYGRMFWPSEQPDIPEDYFAQLAQESDAVVRGRAVRKTSQITEDDSFLFTDYDLVVLEVFKNNATAPIDIGGAITVTCLGGKIIADDVILKAGGNGVALLPVNAQDVLLFLKHIPETQAYMLARYDGGFELTGISARPFAGLFHFDSDFFKDENSFLKTIKEVSK